GHVFRFLGKPWNDEDLKVTIAQAVDQYTLVAENRRLQLLTQQQNEELRQWNASLENRVAERTAQIEELSGRLEASLMGSIETLARVTEMHSSVVGSHSKRVESLSVQISHQLGMDGDALRQVRVAALLHDIGKIAVPGHVLQKRVEQMLPDERDQLREHVSIGESIVREMPNLGPAAQIIRHHHERCDGSGYPDNLTKDMIPIGARIVAVADAWDKALNDKRQFEHATSAKAMDHLLRYTPAWFDKTVVDALQQCLGRNDEPLRLLDQEIDISANDLVPGMVLAHEVRAANGLMLLPAQTRLTEEKINRLRSFSAAHPLAAAIRVVRPRGEVTAGC
ncbi:MAG: HD domain-containing protein, partial [Planctomycetales bacterium]|nr:HD domain-containing protein [Planctomycetales bacterium]